MFLDVAKSKMEFKKLCLFLLFPLVFSIASCVHVISRDLREQADPILNLQHVLTNPPQQYQGKLVVWGGEIIRTTNQKDGSTLIEVLQKPLDRWDEPVDTSASEGRFLIRGQQFLDPLIYSQGSNITVAGEIQGEELMALGETNYRYPVLLEKQIYLWPIYPDYYYPYPGYYDPFWYPYPYSSYFFYHGHGGHHHPGPRSRGFHHHH